MKNQHQKVNYFREKNPHWKGGNYINHAGYRMVYDPSHHRAMDNGYVREHIKIAEKALGGKLPSGVQVHHYGDVSDNSKLIICEDQEYHFYLHIREKAFDACGDARKRKCKHCGKYDYPENMFCKRNGSIKKGGWNVYHLSCARVYDRKRYHSKRVQL